MASIIQIGSPRHNAHLAGVEKEKLIADNREEINELKEKLKIARAAERPDYKAVTDLTSQIDALENPKVILKKEVPNLAEYDAGFEIGKNRQQLEQGASAQKQAGYLAGMSAGNGGSATSPQTAFSEPEKTPKVPARKIVKETETQPE